MIVKELARKTGNSPRTITKWCQVLGYTRHGRDYHLTLDQVRRIRGKMQPVPGRPCPHSARMLP